MEFFKRKVLLNQSDDIYIDFSYFNNSRGDKIQIYKFDLFLSKLLLVFATIFFSLALLSFIAGYSLVFLLFFSFAIYSFMFSFFLRRDRNILDDKIKNIDLSAFLTSKNTRKINFFDFFDFDSLCFVDKCILEKEKFLHKLFYYTSRDKRVQALFQKRLGIDLDYFNQNNISESLVANATNESLFFFFKNLLETSKRLNVSKIDNITIQITFLKFYLNKEISKFEVNQEFFDSFFKWISNNNFQKKYIENFKIHLNRRPIGNLNSSLTSVGTPLINKYGEDLPVTSNIEKLLAIGREDSEERIFRYLENNSGGCILLVGERGTGKTHFLNYIALQITSGNVNTALLEKRLVNIDLNKLSIILGNQDNFKKIFLGILEESSARNNIILSIENIDQIFMFENGIKQQIVNSLINSISRNKNRILATSDTQNFTRYIKPNKFMDTLFERIDFVEPDNNNLFQILADHAEIFEEKFKVSVNFSAIKRIVELKNKFDLEEFLPQKAIVLLEESILKSLSQKSTQIDQNDVDAVVSLKSGVNFGFISSDEANKLLNIEKLMQKKLFGQDEAIYAVSSAIRKARSGITSEKKPLATFLFFGPTGVGKTELAKILAETYYGNSEHIVRLDMSEFQEERNLDRIIGGINDQGEQISGFLVERIRKTPHTIVLLDEIEKANKRVLDLFLQVLDEGFMTDYQGYKVDFRNSIIIATSNIGSKTISNFDLSKGTFEDLKLIVEGELRDFFRLEFLNRFDKLIMFRHLDTEEILKIVDKNLSQIREILKKKGIDIQWNKATLDTIAGSSYSRKFGAREVARVVGELIQDKLASLIISGQVVAGSTIIFKGLDYEIV